jgi:hypothetical protein
MFRIVSGVAALCAAGAVVISAPAAAAEYTVMLSEANGKVLRGRGGLHAADSKLAGSLVRVISPGSRITRRGTVRVLVMNLGQPRFAFGPSQVSLKLADGTEIPKTPMREFREGAELVSREMRRAGTVDRRVKSGLSDVARDASVGPTAATLSGQPTPDTSAVTGAAASRQDGTLEGDALPGARTLAAIDGLLQRAEVAPQEASGGYLVFELPKELRATKADQPFTIVVRAGREEHRIQALLRKR